MLRYKPNPSQVRSLNRKEFENNLENVRELNKNAQIRKRGLAKCLPKSMKV